MFPGWTGVGLFMIVAAARFGNFVNESFGFFPHVNDGDWGKKLILRLAGAGLLGFAMRFALGIVALSRSCPPVFQAVFMKSLRLPYHFLTLVVLK
jgi:hypothetical protein